MDALTIAFAISTGLLTFATGLVFTLRRGHPENQTLINVTVIIRSWWMMLGILLLALAIGPYGVVALFYFATIVAYREYLKVSRLKEIKRVLFPILVVAMSAQYLALLFEAKTLFFVLIPLLAVWIIPTVIVLSASIHNLAQVFGTTLGLMLIGYYLSYVPAMGLILPGSKEHPEQALLAIVVLLLLTEGNDVFQFVSGKLFGRKKIVPLVSPNKTEAGFIGGLILTTGVSLVISQSLLGLNIVQGLALGVVVSITGILGDLLFSALKRYFDVKDFSRLIPGHGGVLDRLDSLVLTAPIFFHMLLLFKEGTVG